MSVERPPTSPPAPGGAIRPGIDLTDHADGSTGDESIGELLGRTTRDISELFRKEVELAKTELREEASGAARAAGMLVAGGLVGYLALLLVLLAAAWGLGELIPLWASLLIVGVITGAVAAILITTGRSRLGQIQAAPTTIETIQEDVTWARQQLS